MLCEQEGLILRLLSDMFNLSPAREARGRPDSVPESSRAPDNGRKGSLCTPDRYVSISVDDGHPTDFRTAELLNKYGLNATFYVPATNSEREVISKQQVRELASRFEIGGHTLNHVTLTSVPPERAWAEIYDGKKWLEEAVGTKVLSFCYPRGKFNRQVVAMTRRAGFIGARTCLFNMHRLPRDPFICGVSTLAHKLSRMVQVRHGLLEGNFEGIVNFFTIHKGVTDWQSQYMQALEYVYRRGGVAHLYLHSWGIDEHHEWGKLEAVFQELRDRQCFTSVSNGQLFQLWRMRNNAS
jgi:peptidoglycan/xylan/chitin deacetylase (PgdA/CDA1 family)